MVLDQFAFAVDGNGNRKEIMRWRKHANMQGWMARIAMRRLDLTKEEDFCFMDLPLSARDIDALEYAVRYDLLPRTAWFFYSAADAATDVEFIERARAAMREGKRIVYSSWW